MKNYDIVKLRIRRFIALFIDWYITSMIAAMPITFYFRENSYVVLEDFRLEHYSMDIALFIGLFALITGIIYYIIIPAFVFKGQTLGKKICKIKVIQQNQREVNLKTLIIREGLGSILIEGGILVTASYFRQLIQLFLSINILENWMYLTYIITLCSIAYAYFNTKTLCFHDIISKTMVVQK